MSRLASFYGFLPARGIACALFLAVAANSWGAGPEAVFKHIDTKSGLPDNSINAMVQDRLGYMWMGTWNGLSLFDGNKHQCFMPVEGDTTSLSNSMVRTLEAVDEGLWVGTDCGIDFYSFDDCKFHHASILRDGQLEPTHLRTNILIRTGPYLLAMDIHGHLLINVGGVVFEEIPAGKNDSFGAVAPYGHDQVVAISDHGICIIDPASRKKIISSANSIPLSQENCNIFYSNNTDLIYLGNGLGRESHTYRINHNNGIEEVEGFVPDNLMQTIDVGSLTYFGTDGQGLWCTDGKGHNKNINITNSNLRAPVIYSLAVDNNKNLWVGSYRNGLWVYCEAFNAVRVDNIEHGTMSFDVVSAIVPLNKKLYIGLDGGGIEVHDLGSGARKVYNSANSSLAGDNVVAMVPDGSKLWLGAYTRGLNCLDTSTGKFERYDINPNFEGNNNAWMICDDQQGHLWICARSLMVFDKESKTFARIDSVWDKQCTSIQLRGNYLWVSTRSDGIFQIDRNSRRVITHLNMSSTPLALPTNQVSYCTIDSRGLLWAGVRPVGLCRIDLQNNTIDILGPEHGIPENRIAAIFEDSQGTIWVSTETSLFRCRPGNSRFERIDDPGLPNGFLNNAFALKGDTIFLGTTTGMVSFKISEIGTSNYQGPTIFHGVQILSDKNKSVRCYGDSPAEIVLEPDENFITVFFSIPELLYPKQVRYSYMLQGLDTDWHDGSFTQQATYTNLDPGSYKLLVRHSLPGGEWSQASVLPLKILPEWYETPLMRILWIVLVLGLIALAFWSYIHNMRVKESIRIARIEKEKEKELNDAKLDFYAQITHDLRTPVFLISAQIEQLLDTHDNYIQVRSSYLSGILRSSMKLNKLINRIIDLRKMDQGKLKLTFVRADVVEFVGSLLPDYELLCQQKNLKFRFQHDAPPLLMDIDPDKLEMILSNLITNAFKYTLEDGAVTLSVRDLDTKVEFAVKDTGIGIVKDAQEAIFERFVRTERGQKQSSGDGLGLAFVKEIVNLYGGTIRVESEPNVGSEFIVELPKQQGVAPAEPMQANLVEGDNDPYLLTEEVATNPTAVHTLLVVDDDVRVADVVVQAFGNDFKVFRATNGQEGLDTARRLHPECVLCDISMPKMDGLEMLSQFKADPSLRKIKFVVFTAKDSEQDMNRGYQLGVDAWFIKPMSLKLLKMHINKLLDTTPQYMPVNPAPEPESDDDAAVLNYNPKDQEFLVRLRELIDNSLLTEGFGAESLADQMSVSHSALYKKVKKLTGMTIVEFVNEYKIWKAVGMFRRGETNVNNVARACGFRDPKTFRDSFRRKMGILPKEYIQSLK